MGSAPQCSFRANGERCDEAMDSSNRFRFFSGVGGAVVTRRLTGVLPATLQYRPARRTYRRRVILLALIAWMAAPTPPRAAQSVEFGLPHTVTLRADDSGGSLGTDTFAVAIR